MYDLSVEQASEFFANGVLVHNSWGFALRTLHGEPWRSEAPLWHLWHPPAERMTRKVGCMESELLRRRYFAAQGSERAMRAMVDEAKGAW